MTKKDLQHKSNSLHVYCRLVDMGFCREAAKQVCEIYENISHTRVYSGREDHEDDFSIENTLTKALNLYKYKKERAIVHYPTTCKEEIVMNKTELVNFVADQTDMTKKDAGVAIDAVLKGIQHGLVEDGKVTLVNFGNFAVKDRAARTARNPKTGEAIDVPAKKVPVFKPSTQLKESVDK